MSNKYLEKVAEIQQREKKASVGSKAFKELKTVAGLSGNPFLSRAAANIEKKHATKTIADNILKGKHTPTATAPKAG